MTAANGVLVTDAKVDLKDHGIDTLTTGKVRAYFKKARPSVVGIHVQPSNLEFLLSFAEELQAQPVKSQNLLVCEDLDPSAIEDLIRKLRPHRILEQLDTPSLSMAFQETFQIHYEDVQNEKLAELINDKNDELKRLSVELENKVQVRQKMLEESISKNTDAEQRLKILKKTMEQIYRAQSVPEIAFGIKEALKSEFQITNAIIRQHNQSNLKDQKNFHQHAVPLKSGKLDCGFLILHSERPESFSREEKKFFSQLPEAIVLSIVKSHQVQKEQDISLQWEATFDAISDPVCLTDSQYNILRTNKAFHAKTGSPPDHGGKCYKVLFDRASVCEGCQRGVPFRLKSHNKANEVYEVHSNPVQDHHGITYFQIYRDMTQSLNLERQVIESAKMAELGTISSSIAHELNNPIGGMLNFLQLMQMDLDGSEDYFADIVEIEKGTQKCKTIVQNLLGFSRKSGEHSRENIDLMEVIEQAIKITELKTSSIGITINRHFEIKVAKIEGWFNLLAHAFRNILQNSQESIIEKRQLEKSYKGTIDVRVEELKDVFQITISDDGMGIEPQNLERLFDPLFTTKDPTTNAGLGLTLVQQIVKEHKGSVYVTSQKDKTIAVIATLIKSEVES